MKPKAKHPPKTSLLSYLAQKPKPGTESALPSRPWPISISHTKRLRKGRVEFRMGDKVVARCSMNDYTPRVAFDNVVYSTKDSWVKGFVGLMKGPKP